MLWHVTACIGAIFTVHGEHNCMHCGRHELREQCA